MRRGKLIGLGVGPGDPDLLTLRAARLIAAAPAIAFIAAAGRASRAREIASGHIGPTTRELIAVMPMTADPEQTGRAYSQLVTGIIGELGQGNDVVFLCEGDPLLYGSFVNLLSRLANRFEVEVVPGITSISASAAASLTPLAMGEEAIAICPLTMPAKRLTTMLQNADRAVLLKVGRHLEKAKEALAAARMLDGAMLVENATLPAQRVRPLKEVAEPSVPYFSLIIAGRKRQG
ncbi:MAG: precorrin-2 C(20)-methyltransferase [Geminicoccaceae bacterium]